MDEMYNMTILAHRYSVYFLILVFFLNFLFLIRAKNIINLKKIMKLFNPYNGIAIAALAFTGSVMMAAKHLSFTIENILMIVINVALIILMSKRAKTLKFTNSKNEEALNVYKKFALNIIKIEIIIVASISAWMWLAA
jgi:hypothetical protein